MYNIFDKGDDSMNDKLQAFCNRVSKNIVTASEMYKLNYSSSAVAFGIANADREADLDKIAEAKQIIKEKVGAFSVFGGGAPRMLLISKMAGSGDPLETFNKINEIYNSMKKVFCDSAFIGVLAAFLTGYQKDLGELSKRSSELIKFLKKKHGFLGVTSEDHFFIAFMAASDKSIEDMMSESEAIFEAVRGEFKFAKSNAYLLSYLLSTYDELTEWKLKTSLALLKELKESKFSLSSYNTISILAPLTAASMRTDRHILVCDTVEADKFLASQKVIGGFFGISENIRHILAAALVLKTHAEEADEPFSIAEYLTAMSCQSQIKSEQDSSTYVPD